MNSEEYAYQLGKLRSSKPYLDWVREHNKLLEDLKYSSMSCPTTTELYHEYEEY